MIHIFGLKNCDTCRKALKWLDGASLAYQFHDLRADGVEPDRLRDWLAKGPAERIVNRKSTTWRTLSDNDKAMADGPKVTRLLTENPTLIKRPIIERGRDVFVGWTDDVKSRLAK